ncbi:MAG: hypothetical protein MJA31_11905, partial [Clostridia bacterium]|nr:hypothetical protein [Clostridia bacterium]
MSEIILDTYYLELNNENFSEGIEDAEKQVKEFESEMNKFSSFLKESVVSALVKTSDSGLELNEVFKDLKVTTNEATNELSDMKQSLLDISNNYGKSFTGITEGINNVRQATEQANKEYEKTIGIGSTMKDIFENDVKGSINSVSPIIENIGQTSGNAYKSIENEAQNSLNKNTVLLNTLNKHMVNFASSGINADTFTAMVVEGANGIGALDVAVSALITKFVMLNGTKISSFFSTLVSSIQRVGIQMTALSVKARAATLATSALKAGLTFGASMAVFALIKGIKEYNDKLEQNKLRIEQTKIASDNLKESMEEFRTNLDTESIDNVRNALTDLANAMGYTEAIAKKARLEKELEGLKKAPFTGWERYRQNEIEKELKDSKKIIDDYSFKKKYIEMEIYHTQKAQAEKAQNEEYEEKEEYSHYVPQITHTKPIDLDKKYEPFKNTFEDLEHEADVLKEKLSQLEGQDRIPMLENLNNIYEKQKDALHLLNNERREEAAQILGLNKEAIAQMTYEEMRSIEVTKEQRDRLNELIPALQKTSEKWWNISSAQKENLSEMKNINEEIKNLKREHVKTIADAESKIVVIYERESEEKLKAIQKEHDDELEMLEKHHDKKQKEYDKDLDNYKKHIQSQINALNEASDKEDFDKSLAEKQEELNEIQKKINELSLVTGDNESARAALIEKAELENEFAEKQEEIDEFIADRNKNLKIEALEESLADYEEYIENQKSIADSEFEHKKQLLDKELQDKTQALEAEYSKEKLYSKARKMLLSGEYDELTTMFMDYQ